MDAKSGELISQAGISWYPDQLVAFMFAGCTLQPARDRVAYTAYVVVRAADAHSIGIEYIGLFTGKTSSLSIVGIRVLSTTETCRSGA